MTIDELIDAMLELRTQQGSDVDVTVLQYNGGDYVLCDIVPKFNEEEGVVVLDTFYR